MNKMYCIGISTSPNILLWRVTLVKWCILLRWNAIKQMVPLACLPMVVKSNPIVKSQRIIQKWFSFNLWSSAIDINHASGAADNNWQHKGPWTPVKVTLFTNLLSFAVLNHTNLVWYLTIIWPCISNRQLSSRRLHLSETNLVHFFFILQNPYVNRIVRSLRCIISKTQARTHQMHPNCTKKKGLLYGIGSLQ